MISELGDLKGRKVAKETSNTPSLPLVIRKPSPHGKLQWNLENGQDGMSPSSSIASRAGDGFRVISESLGVFDLFRPFNSPSSETIASNRMELQPGIVLSSVHEFSNFH